MKAVIYTDVMQFAVLIAGVTLTLLMALRRSHVPFYRAIATRRLQCPEPHPRTYH